MCNKLVFFTAILLIISTQIQGQNDPNPVGYWNFDDGTAGDLSGNSNDGTFVGSASLNIQGKGLRPRAATCHQDKGLLDVGVGFCRYGSTGSTLV